MPLDRTVDRARALAGRPVDPHRVVAGAALAALLLRLPALTRPLRADEAGFLLVARSWAPRPESMFGPFWVDRPPSLVAVYQVIDAVGGEPTLRLLGAVVAGLSVLLAATLAGVVAPGRAVPWTAVVTAALLSNPMIDVVAVKGELLALPFLLTGFVLTLRAVRRTSVGLALLAGLSAGAAVGLKQNLVTGLVFAAVLLVTAVLTGRLARRTALRLGLAGAVGAAIPVLATLGWARGEGVRLSTLWYAVYGFRSDAARVIAEGAADAPQRRALILLVIALATGLLPVLAGLVVHVRELWPEDPPLVAATLAVVTVDVAGLVAGGSFWQDYLTPLVPGAALVTALLAGRASRGGRRMRIIVLAAGVSALLAMGCWLVWNLTGHQEFDEARTGSAIEAAAAPGDTLVVFGGRADLQYASGLDSPYPYLWSLPMRTRDPGYADLRALLEGPRAPTWLVEWVEFGAWTDAGVAELERAVAERYAVHGRTCHGHPVYLLRGVDRPPVTPRC